MTIPSLLLALHFLAFQSVSPVDQTSVPSSTEAAPAGETTSHGIYLYIYRTSAHIHRSSSLVCEEVKDRLSDYLSDHQIELRRIESSECSSLPEEAQAVATAMQMSETLQRARAVHASYVLLLILDRPVMAWLKLTLQCFDLSGTELWKEVASNGSALTGGVGLDSALKRMEERLGLRIGQPGLIVEAEKGISHSTQGPIQPSLIREPVPSPSGTAPPRAEQTARETGSLEPETKIELPEGTLVRLMLTKPVDSRMAAVGDKLELSVLEDVKVGDLVVIPRKSPASATVAALTPPQRKHVSGRITIRIESVLLINRDVAALRSMQTLKSDNLKTSLKTQKEINEAGPATGGIAYLFLPLWALKHGDYVILPAGMEFATALDHSIVLEHSVLQKMQPPPEERLQGKPVITVYHRSSPPGDQPNFYVGRAKIARLQNATQFQLTLPPGKYWFRCDESKWPVSLTLEPGGVYYLRVDSLMTWGNPDNPGFSRFIHLREHDVGELEVSEHTPLDPTSIKDVSKIDVALLAAKPQ
jgi:hypothetical protein